MEQCARCGHELGIGRFCVNCGHPTAADAAADTAAGSTGDTGPGAAPTEVARPTESPWGPVAPAAPPPAYATPPQARYPMYADDPAPEHPTWTQPAVPDPSATRRRPVLPWVLAGLALLLVAAAGVFLLLGTGDDDAPEATDQRSSDSPGAGPTSSEADDTSPSPTEPTSEPTTGGGAPAEIARTATVVPPSTAPPSVDVNGNAVRYDGANMLDGQPDTTWRTPGDASGQTVALTLPESVVLSSVGLLNGYAKTDPGYDGYTANRRVLRVEWVFPDGTVVPQTLTESREVQSVPVDTVADSVQLRILEVSPPGRGPAGRDFTAISEVSLVGAPA